MEDKPKRALSKWQIYLKGCLKEQSKEIGLGQKVTACGVQYRHLKEKDPEALKDLIESIKMRDEKAKNSISHNKL